MNNKKRHYVRNSLRSNFYKAQTFFFYWKIVRLRNMVGELCSSLTNELNNCGWVFKEDDRNHRLYKKHQTGEELQRLCAWVTSEIYYKHKDYIIPDDLKIYAYKLCVNMHNYIQDFYGGYLSYKKIDLYRDMSKSYILKLERNL